MEIHFTEILLILLVALLFIKPEQLPKIAVKLGRFLGSAEKALEKFKQVIKKPFDEMQK